MRRCKPRQENRCPHKLEPANCDSLYEDTRGQLDREQRARERRDGPR